MANGHKNRSVSDRTREGAGEFLRRGQPDDMAPPPEQSSDEDGIRLRAYELYLERGTDGDDLTDWLRAEDEYRSRGASTQRTQSDSSEQRADA